MTKLLVGFDTGSYTFNPTTKQITITGISEQLQLENLLLITNVTDNIILYNFADNTLGATVSNNVITLNYNTTTMSSTDDIQIYVDTILDTKDQIPTVITPDIKGQQPSSQAMPVALSNEQYFDLQTPITVTTNAPIGTVLLMQDCLQYRSVGIQVNTNASVTAGIISFECSNSIDSASNSWTQIALMDATSGTVIGAPTCVLAGGQFKHFSGSIPFRYFRVRVTASITGGTVSISGLFRMTSYSQLVNQTANTPINIVQTGGGNVVGQSGTFAVAGTANVGSAITLAQPPVIGGVDINNLVRRIITDVIGHTITVGADPTKVAGTNPVTVRDADNTDGRRSPSELLELILYELKLQSFYLKETPLMLSTNGQFKEEITDFTNSADKN